MSKISPQKSLPLEEQKLLFLLTDHKKITRETLNFIEAMKDMPLREMVLGDLYG